MFLVNSRYPLVCATPSWLPKKRSPLSLSYGSILPSSFNIVLSSALVYSTCPPVSVSGTVYCRSYFLERLRCRINPIRPNNLRHSSLPAGPGILTWFPSTTPFGLALGAGSPCAD
jgi:hypothetical protein